MAKGKKEKEKKSSKKTRTSGQMEKDIIPAKDKNPDDMEILE